jgi:hypothetical protein
MFAEKIGESCLTTGTGTLSLTQTAYGAFRTWRSGFSSGEPVFYLDTNDSGTIWEIGYGTFTTGSPDTLTRTLIASSSGALIDWQAVHRVYSIPTATALKHMLSPLAVARPAWLPSGGTWLDYALGYVSGAANTATAWVKKLYNGSVDIEEGRHYMAAGIFAASQRALFVDKGAASYTFTAADIGKVLAFDCTASARVLTMLAAATTGMGHGAYVFVYPYGSTSNGVTFTPGGADTTDLATAPSGRCTKFMWDGARSKWVADYSQAYIDSIGVRQVVSTITGAVATGSTQVPFDDTIPQNTEGDQYMSLAITPKSATSKLVIEVVANFDSSAPAGVIMALFQDSVANALAASWDFVDTASGRVQVVLRYVMTSGTTSATTFKVRAGPDGAATLTFNGGSGGRKLGGVMASGIVITEIGG